MRLGLMLQLWDGRDMKIPVERVRQAERLGYDTVWSAEAYGADAITPLAYLAGHTESIRLGTSVMQLAARPPAAAAMAVATLDAISDGRAICGLGVSGPQIVEGWYGQPWGRPVARIRDYVAIMRKVWQRDEPVSHDGPEFQLPYRGPGSIGEGKPLRSILHPRPDIPIWIGCGGPASVALTAEIADGWLPMGFGPGMLDHYLPALQKGFERGGRRLRDLEIQASVTVQITDDPRPVLDARRRQTALYVGGMGSESHNFHRDAMARRGYAEAAHRIQELFLAGKRDEAVAAVPEEYLLDGTLLGSEADIREGWKQWENCGATGITIHTDQMEALELMAELAR